MTSATDRAAARPLPDLAVLLGSPGCPAVVVPAPAWKLPTALPDAEVVLWGLPALPPGTGGRAAASAALARTRALALVVRHPPDGRVVRAVHRLAPPALRTGTRARLRKVLLQGAVVELVRRDAHPRVLDLVAVQAGVRRLPPLQLGAGSTLLAMVDTPAGPAVLRVGISGGGGDPTAAAPALDRLSGDALVPRLLGSGTVDRAAWTLESRLPGSRPRAADAALLEQVARFCARMPRTGRPASAGEDLRGLAASLPVVAPRLEPLAAQADQVLVALPGVARHGDLWSGNLLVQQGRLTGVLDWDGWRADGVPGTDLLHLVATDDRLRSRRPLGAVFQDRPWEWPTLRQADSTYWRALGLDPTPQQRRAVGMAWWAAQVVGDLVRTPGLAENHRWVQQNVLDVLAALER